MGGEGQPKPAHALIKEWIARGQGHDLVVIPDIWIAEFAVDIEPFENYMPRGFSFDYFPVLYKKGIFDGKLLGPVWATSTKALIYRSDLFEKASTTYSLRSKPYSDR